jgi:hypothetical protein
VTLIWRGTITHKIPSDDRPGDAILMVEGVEPRPGELRVLVPATELAGATTAQLVTVVVTSD